MHDMALFLRRGLLFSLCLMLAASAGRAGEDKVAPPDPVMGDWQGHRVLEDGTVQPLVAQVIALGKGRYRANFLPEIDRRVQPIVVLEGRRGKHGVEFSGSTRDGLLRDTEWRGSIRKNRFSGKISGRQSGHFELQKITRLSPTLGAKPPQQAIVLFDGKNFDAWEHPGKTPRPVQWRLTGDGAMQVKKRTGSIATRQKFTDFRLHLEFRTPFKPEARGQERGNSGVYMQGRYEVQVLDSYGLEGRDNECGGVYKVAPPRVNMCAPPGQWQTYDITFFAPRFDASGEKIENARLSVWHNGVLIHDNLGVPHPTGGELDRNLAQPGPLLLQDHGNPVEYRNIWLLPLPYRRPLAKSEKARIEALATAAAPQKIEIIRDLAAQRVYPAAEALLRSAKDADPEVRLASIRALRVLAGQEHLPALVDLLISAESPQERRECIDCISFIAHFNPDREQRAAPVRDALPYVNRKLARIALQHVLVNLGDTSVLPELRQALADSARTIRQAAVRALADWPNPAPLPDLLQVLHSSRADSLRRDALQGAIRMQLMPSGQPPAQSVTALQELLELAQTDAEKRLVLQGLGQVPAFPALQMAAAYLDSSHLKAAAEAAVVAIAGSTGDSHPAETRSLLQRLRERTEADSLAQKAQRIVAYIDRYDDHLTTWQVAGPYSKKEVDLFDYAFAPEKHPDAVSWQRMPDSTDAQRPWLLELDKLFGGDDRVAYLRTRVWSEREQEVQLQLGSDDAVKAWLDGKLVHANKVFRGVAPVQDTVAVILKSGWNELMLKIVQAGGGWGACARFRHADGSAVEGLRVSLDGFRK